MTTLWLTPCAFVVTQAGMVRDLAQAQRQLEQSNRRVASLEADLDRSQQQAAGRQRGSSSGSVGGAAPAGAAASLLAAEARAHRAEVAAADLTRQLAGTQERLQASEAKLGMTQLQVEQLQQQLVLLASKVPDMSTQQLQVSHRAMADRSYLQHVSTSRSVLLPPDSLMQADLALALAGNEALSAQLKAAAVELRTAQQGVWERERRIAGLQVRCMPGRAAAPWPPPAEWLMSLLACRPASR